jgi:outer membrane protein assembly factor BamE (lipoprotein component of BamABCDE complex)
MRNICQIRLSSSILVGASLLLSACIYVPPVWNADDAIYGVGPIEVGSTTKEVVVETLGAPNTTSGPNIYRYHGDSDHGFACLFIWGFGGCNIVDEKSWWVEITFDDNGVVKEVTTSDAPSPPKAPGI